MLTNCSNHLQIFTEQTPFLSVSRIELFVIPALAVDATGHRVCLRLTSNQGIGWSELFASDTEDTIDLDRWSDLLQSFIGSVPLAPLDHFQYDKTDQDGRIIELFATAAQHILANSADSSTYKTNLEESVLRQRSVSYVSLD
ncbi:hypothetical protein BK133_09965 [Paenibacillus sp. FSL H8-0548]|uniref:hypothetical protein n=1 Tax=Paenibacillus sp. FSL H8-0548 TaxID=1920422 RepID=UPI00096FAB13|nr:hypothetical protein [Paenibacillus sp. FSL H8-0548]OMF36001.1 hypothetical protein BK133_09965 [Paenibacillus sp. FSL H8-0548]